METTPANILSQMWVRLQGDCLSASEFKYYLAKTLQNNNCGYEHDNAELHQPSITSQCLQEHNYSRYITSNHSISQEYADYINEITSNPDRIKHLKENIPRKLAERNLIINESKTEEYIISRSNQGSKTSLLKSRHLMEKLQTIG